MDLKKIGGWVLLGVGLAILMWSVYTSFNIFTGRASAPQIIKIEKQNIQNQSDLTKTPTTEAEIQKQMENIVSSQLGQLIPTETINQLLNMIVWAVFASFLIFAGFYTGSLGIKLLK
jgi:hypothetical protein